MFQVEPAFVDSLVNAFRRTPVSHKLGVLYIIDSITRQWVASGAAHAGGVRRMTDNLPSLMTELLPVTPEGQKVWLRHAVLWPTVPPPPPTELQDSSEDADSITYRRN
jgi:protein NRD1